MTRVVWTAPALQDAEEIRDYIAQDSPRYAQLVTERLVAAAERLANYPELGRVVPELRRPELRELIVGRYRVVYRLRGGDAEIAAVVHGARDFPNESFDVG